MAQSLSALYVHLTWSTKDRVPFLREPTLRKLLHAYLGATSRNLDSPSAVVGGAEDHIHILARMARSITVADWVKELKRVSSVWIKSQDRGLYAFHWQGGYAAFSVSPSNLEQVANYVADQERHHKKMTFQDELRALLKRHGIAWDERYIWD